MSWIAHPVDGSTRAHGEISLCRKPARFKGMRAVGALGTQNVVPAIKWGDPYAVENPLYVPNTCVLTSEDRTRSGLPSRNLYIVNPRKQPAICDIPRPSEGFQFSGKRS